MRKKAPGNNVRTFVENTMQFNMQQGQIQQLNIPEQTHGQINNTNSVFNPHSSGSIGLMMGDENQYECGSGNNDEDDADQELVKVAFDAHFNPNNNTNEININFNTQAIHNNIQPQVIPHIKQDLEDEERASNLQVAVSDQQQIFNTTFQPQGIPQPMFTDGGATNSPFNPDITLKNTKKSEYDQQFLYSNALPIYCKRRGRNYRLDGWFFNNKAYFYIDNVLCCASLFTFTKYYGYASTNSRKYIKVAEGKFQDQDLLDYLRSFIPPKKEGDPRLGTLICPDEELGIGIGLEVPVCAGQEFVVTTDNQRAIQNSIRKNKIKQEMNNNNFQFNHIWNDCDSFEVQITPNITPFATVGVSGYQYSNSPQKILPDEHVPNDEQVEQNNQQIQQVQQQNQNQQQIQNLTQDLSKLSSNSPGYFSNLLNFDQEIPIFNEMSREKITKAQNQSENSSSQNSQVINIKRKLGSSNVLEVPNSKKQKIEIEDTSLTQQFKDEFSGYFLQYQNQEDYFVPEWVECSDHKTLRIGPDQFGRFKCEECVKICMKVPNLSEMQIANDIFQELVIEGKLEKNIPTCTDNQITTKAKERQIFSEWVWCQKHQSCLIGPNEQAAFSCAGCLHSCYVQAEKKFWMEIQKYLIKMKQS